MGAGYWLLGTGYWLLGIGYWLLDARYLVLDTGYWILVTGYWILDTGYLILDTGCLILDAGFWMLVENPVFKREYSILDTRCWFTGCPLFSLRLAPNALRLQHWILVFLSPDSWLLTSGSHTDPFQKPTISTYIIIAMQNFSILI